MFEALARWVLRKPPRLYYMDWSDIDDPVIFPAAGWYVEWRREVFGPFDRRRAEEFLRTVEERRRA